MESGTNNIACLHLLLCAAQPCLLGPVARAGFRDEADRQEQCRRGARRGVEPQGLRLCADQPRGQYRPLPAHRAPAAADPADTRGTAALPPPGDHRHQGFADPA